MSCDAMAKGYLPYEIDQRLLLPRDMRCWLPEGHLSLFILDVVAELAIALGHNLLKLFRRRDPVLLTA